MEKITIDQFVNINQISSSLKVLIKVLNYVEKNTDFKIVDVDFLTNSITNQPLTLDGFKLKFEL